MNPYVGYLTCDLQGVRTGIMYVRAFEKSLNYARTGRTYVRACTGL